jgi:hypothetical protein
MNLKQDAPLTRSMQVFGANGDVQVDDATTWIPTHAHP